MEKRVEIVTKPFGGPSQANQAKKSAEFSFKNELEGGSVRIGANNEVILSVLESGVERVRDTLAHQGNLPR